MTAQKKSKYVPVEKVRTVTFRNGNQRMDVVLSRGKKGFNTRVTIRTKDGDDTDTQTGGRAVFATEADGIKAFDKLVAEATREGWTISSTGKNAFTSIPKPNPVQAGSLQKPRLRRASADKN